MNDAKELMSVLGRKSEDRIRNLDELYERFRKVTGFSVDQAIGLFLEGYTLRPPRHTTLSDVFGNGGRSKLSNNVDHPAHYNTGRYEAIDVIEDWKLGFCLGNALKYIARADHKGTPIEDLKKAAWYINREVQAREHTEEEKRK